MKLWGNIKHAVSRSGRLGLAILLVAAILIAGGVNYAIYAGTIEMTGKALALGNSVEPLCWDANIPWVVTNDDGKTSNVSGFTPIDPGDDGKDPSGPVGGPPPLPAIPGEPFSKWNKDVGVTTASISSNGTWISLLINNAYPYYHPTVYFSVCNQRSQPGTITGIELINDNKTADGQDMITAFYGEIFVGQVIQPGQCVVGTLGVQVEQIAMQSTVYPIKLKVTLIGKPVSPDKPALDIEKYVNGQDADTPETAVPVKVGDNVTFTFVVKNTGNVTLSNIVVTDSVYGNVGTIPSLAPGETAPPFTLVVKAVGGLHINLACAQAIYKGTVVRDCDYGKYRGQQSCTGTPGLDIEKYVNGQDADTPETAVPVNVGDDVVFIFVVRNTGNVRLESIAVTDSVYGAVGTIPGLEPGASQTLTLVRKAVEGLHINKGTAQAVYCGQTVSDWDYGKYVGKLYPGSPVLDIEKYVNGQDADTPETAVPVTVGSPVTFTFIVRNTGAVILENIEVTDSVLGYIGTIASLAPGATSQVFSKVVPAVQGFHINIGTAHAVYNGQTVSDWDYGKYTGLAGTLPLPAVPAPDNDLNNSHVPTVTPPDVEVSGSGQANDVEDSTESLVATVTQPTINFSKDGSATVEDSGSGKIAGAPDIRISDPALPANASPVVGTPFIWQLAVGLAALLITLLLCLLIIFRRKHRIH